MNLNENSAPISTCVLWLHNLSPLDEQDPKLFERNLSYPTALTTPRARNAAIPKDETAKEIGRTRLGNLSLYKEVENFKPLAPKEIVKSGTPLEAKTRSASKIERNVVYRNAWLFVEMRKVLRQ